MRLDRFHSPRPTNVTTASVESNITERSDCRALDTRHGLGNDVMQLTKRRFFYHLRLLSDGHSRGFAVVASATLDRAEVIGGSNL